jgi:hypothetical protein
MVEEDNDGRELWLNIIDSLAEINEDAKRLNDRRLLRHVRAQALLINELGQTLTKMGSKKGFLR